MQPHAQHAACHALEQVALTEGYVHSYDTGSMVDGPGSRFVVFLAGCPLRCTFCHNPDSWRACSGAKTPVDDVVTKIKPFVRYLKAARGGVTLSGGEPLVQQRFATELFERCKTVGLHTAVETSGCIGSHLTQRMLDATDLFMLDVKSFDDATYARITSAPRQRMIDFARRLADAGKAVWMSIVLIPGLTDVPEHLQALAAFARELGNVRRLDVRPFHQMGRDKWHELRMNYPLDNTPVPTAEQLDAARAIARI